MKCKVSKVCGRIFENFTDVLLDSQNHIKRNVWRHKRRINVYIFLQYYYDASEAESWMSEQELNMMGDERGKDEASASAMLKKHETLEAAIADYSETVNELGDTANALVESEHPER